MKKQKIVLATGNKGKVKEMADVLAEFGFEFFIIVFCGIGQLNITDCKTVIRLFRNKAAGRA